MATPFRPLEERLWAKVVKQPPPGCWLWIGAKNQNEEGYITSGGGRAARPRMRRVTRVVWELTYGPIPEGLFVLHDCPDGDNPACVNPSHLWLGTQKQNMEDCVAKGRLRPRFKPGENHPSAQLSPADIEAICLLRGLMPQREIGRRFGIRRNTVSSIQRGARWQHIKRSTPAPLPRPGRPKITPAEVRLVRRLYGTMARALLAKWFGLSELQVARIGLRQSWKWVADEVA